MALEICSAARNGDVSALDAQICLGTHVDEACDLLTFDDLCYWQSTASNGQYSVTFRNCCALHVAVYFRHPDIVAALLAHGADIEQRAPEILFHTTGTYASGTATPLPVSTPAAVNSFLGWPRSAKPGVKWRYETCTVLHLAIAGEECATAPLEDARRVTLILLQHIRSRMQLAHVLSSNEIGQATSAEPLWSTERRRALVEAHATSIEWWYRGGPFWKLDGVTALHAAIFFESRLETGRGLDDARELVGLVHADRSTIHFRRIQDDASHLADGDTRLSRLTARELCERWYIAASSEGEEMGQEQAAVAPGRAGSFLDWDLRAMEAWRVVIGSAPGEPTAMEVAAAVAAATEAERQEWLQASDCLAVDAEETDEFTVALRMEPVDVSSDSDD